ncbi:transporter substrate-binding domain-containing protein [Lactococcus garvieae]|uniref:transporter substrate-binding domain-containing protein n=1 Tax=Lactococcus garvieae TaxID=1363 RepID=UPI0038529D6F
MKINKVITLLALSAAGVTLLAACSTSNKSTTAGQEKTTTVNVAISGSSNPYEYTKDGQLTGYEYDILKKADENFPQYKFDFKTYDDSAILAALDAGRADIGVNIYGKTKAREEKYLFSFPTTQGINAIFSNDKDKITTIEGLVGKKTEIPTGTNYGDIMDQWNSAHPDKKITVDYSKRGLAERLQALSDGQMDFIFASKSAAENLVKEHAVTGVSDTVPTDLEKYPEFKTYTYYILDNSQTQLQKDLNQEIKKMAEDGYLKELSQKYFGGDQVPGMEQYK